MEVALYDPEHGYYSAPDAPTGWRGDYLTSPELDPAFGALWTGAFEQIFRACGRPDGFTLAEIGPGAGGFTAAVLGAAGGSFAESLRFVLVEISETRRAALTRRFDDDRISISESVDAVDSLVGCVFANEVLDNLPVHVIEARDGRVVELYVDRRDGDLIERWLPCSNRDVLDGAGRSITEGSRIEVCPAAERMAARCAGLVTRGAVVFVDYGRRPDQEDTLLAYSATGVDDRLLERPGAKDLTHHVDWGPVIATLRAGGFRVGGPIMQRDVLRALGSDDLDRDLTAAHRRAVAEGRGVEGVRTASRRQALAALCDRSGRGGVQVIAALKDIDVPYFLTQSEVAPSSTNK